MLRWIVKNYRTFLWAFALAVAVWVSSVTSADPDQTRALDKPIPIQIIGQSADLVFSKPIAKDVSVTLRAPSSIWTLIEENPNLVRATLDISGLGAGEHTLNLQVQVDARPVQIVSISQPTIAFSLESLISKTMKVDLRVSGEAAVGYQIGEATLDPLRVVLSGAQSQVEKVSRIRASVDLNRIRESLDQTVKVEALDERGQVVGGITLSPDTIHVILPVSQRGGYRDVAVKVVTSGRVASGYRLTDISVSPPVVTIYSPNPELINNLPGVLETKPLDLQNAEDDIITRLELDLPQGVSIIGEQMVFVQAGISPIESSLTLTSEGIDVVGLDEKLDAQISPSNVDIILSGPLSVLETLTRQSVRVTVDLTGMTEGKYQLTPKVEILVANVKVESILPNTIEVILSPASATPPAPTPTRNP
ncbi:MAG: hypothetical protein LC099_05935 [Anaerolineales bacterium]|nr:hypothetical protein [Anaerolineales bacterium]